MKNRLEASAATLMCVLTTLLVASPPARAVTPASDSAPSAKVGIADIDLASAAGRKQLNSRVRLAASRICLTTNVEPVKVRTARAKCYRTALTNGARAIGHVGAMRGDRSAATVQLATSAN